jgi:Tfp pilus assembly protein PilP
MMKIRILRALLAIAAAALPTCATAANHIFAETDADMHDLKTWLAATRRQTAASAVAPSTAHEDQIANPMQISTQAQPYEATPAGQPIATRDPFVQLALKVIVPSSAQEIPAKETTLHLLGTVRDGNTAYALIKADRQVLCIASNTSLPSYAIKVTGITDHAITLDRLLPDGGHQLSTLRLGE